MANISTPAGGTDNDSFQTNSDELKNGKATAERLKRR